MELQSASSWQVPDSSEQRYSFREHQNYKRYEDYGNKDWTRGPVGIMQKVGCEITRINHIRRKWGREHFLGGDQVSQNPPFLAIEPEISGDKPELVLDRM